MKKILISLLLLISCSKDTSGPESDIILTDIDGNVYKTVRIGNQLWMAENLKVTRYRNGDVIPSVIDDSLWGQLVTGAYSHYDNNSNNVELFGLLYNFYVVSDERNIAPLGWHVPTDKEWKELEMYLGMSQNEADQHFGRGTDEGGKLKQADTLIWQSPNTGATNEIEFTALPCGNRKTSGYFKNINKVAYFWSSSEYGSLFAWFRYLAYNRSDIFRFNLQKQYGYSIRFIKD